MISVRSLALGAHEGGKFVYVGNVGTGWNARTRAAIYAKLTKLSAKAATVALPRGVSIAGLHWVKPKLVGEVAFTEWTNDGILRHPSFQGMREDKTAKEVVIERPVGESGLKVRSHWPTSREGDAHRELQNEWDVWQIYSGACTLSRGVKRICLTRHARLSGTLLRQLGIFSG